MEADWLRFYRRDFRADVGELGVRRLRALVEGLPPDAMLWRRTPGWGTEQELAAVQIEVTHAVVRTVIAAFSKRGSAIPKPLHVPRPTDARKQPPRRKATAADFAKRGRVVHVSDVRREVGV